MSVASAPNPTVALAIWQPDRALLPVAEGLDLAAPRVRPLGAGRGPPRPAWSTARAPSSPTARPSSAPRRWPGFSRACSGPSRMSGVMVPPTVHGALANLALALLGKVPVNLNYTASQSIVDSSIDQCGITARPHVGPRPGQVQDHAEGGANPPGRPAEAGEDGRQGVRGAWWPRRSPRRRSGPSCRACGGRCSTTRRRSSSRRGRRATRRGSCCRTATSSRTSTSSSSRSSLSDDEVILGVLPFFHSFGFTVTIWGVFSLGIQGRLPLQPARRPGDRQPLPGAQGDDPALHADVLPGLPQALRARPVRDDAAADPGGREAQARGRPADPRRAWGSSPWKGTAAPSFRPWWR